MRSKKYPKSKVGRRFYSATVIFQFWFSPRRLNFDNKNIRVNFANIVILNSVYGLYVFRAVTSGLKWYEEYQQLGISSHSLLSYKSYDRLGLCVQTRCNIYYKVKERGLTDNEIQFRPNLLWTLFYGHGNCPTKQFAACSLRALTLLFYQAFRFEYHRVGTTVQSSTVVNVTHTSKRETFHFLIIRFIHCWLFCHEGQGKRCKTRSIWATIYFRNILDNWHRKNVRKQRLANDKQAGVWLSRHSSVD